MTSRRADQGYSALHTSTAADEERKATFDRVAEQYHRARPGYPEALFEDLIALSGIPQEGRILEVGCGPGTATLPIARRGYAILCLELGASLAALAARNCQPFPHVEVHNISFEDWPLQPHAFDLVMSASAFHWIPPEVGYPKAAAALKESGALALFWSHSPPSDDPFYGEAKKVWQNVAPEVTSEIRSPTADDYIEMTVADIDATGLFGEVSVRHYGWTQSYNAEQYVELLSTYSVVQSLGDDRRQEALARIQGLVEQFGGTVARPYMALLYVAKSAT